MDPDVGQSGFWFHGRLLPGADAHFYVTEEAIGDGLMLEVLWDGIALWSRPDLEPPQPSWRDAIRSPEQAARMLRLISGAYGLLTGDVYEARLTGWVEAKEAKWGDTVVGFSVERFNPHGPGRKGRTNARMATAAKLAVAASRAPGTRLALLDLYATPQAPDDDAFFYAYRAVEDLARHYGGGDEGQKAWDALHAHCGYRDGKKRLKPLTDVRQAIAHGNESDPAVVYARENRGTVLNLARYTLARAFVNDPDLPLSRSDVQGYR